MNGNDAIDLDGCQNVDIVDAVDMDYVLEKLQQIADILVNINERLVLLEKRAA
jgi:hypothetical protein